ncbi:MAG TPA: hypothetical protein VFS58_15785 [Steroidobacteraceae bacterium]|nr:hypothetical protein [Steroidobacteraceae bacterium]
MNVVIDSTGVMYFGDERETSRNCPQCNALSRMSPTALPTFDELLLQKPRAIGLVMRCHACNAPVFLRYAVRAYASNRVELSPQAFDVERPIEKFAFNYVPECVEVFFREALICYSHNQYQAFASMCRRAAGASFQDLGNPTKLRLFDSLSDVREMAEIDEETFAVVIRIIFAGHADPQIDLPFINTYQAAVLLEVMKDFLYQAYVRKGRLQHAMKVRRFFVDESAARMASREN